MTPGPQERPGNALKERVEAALDVIKKHAGQNPAVSFSGGKDSLVALDLAYQSGIRKAVFSNTTIDFDETVEYVKTVEEYYGLKIDIVGPPKDFFKFTEVFGFPTRRWRWCCEVVKFGPLGKYALENEITGYITGLRSEETIRRRNYGEVSRNPLIPVPQVNPIIAWKPNDVWGYINSKNLPVNPLYSTVFDRVGCWVCPYKTKADWENIKQFSPEAYRGLKEILLKNFERYQGLGILDLQDFVKEDEDSWATYSYPQISTLKCFVEECDGSYKLNFDGQSDLEKVESLLPIVAEHYEKSSQCTLEFNTGVEKRKVKVLIEKALNCAGCGACLPTCTRLALRLEGGMISVDSKKCVKCHRCLSTMIIRGACVGRNYSLIRQEAKFMGDEFNTNGEKMGIVRTRLPLDRIDSKKVNKKISGHVSVKRVKNFTELEVKTTGDLIGDMFKIRNHLLQIL